MKICKINLSVPNLTKEPTKLGSAQVLKKSISTIFLSKATGEEFGDSMYVGLISK
jgi:hypothetical protein